MTNATSQTRLEATHDSCRRRATRQRRVTYTNAVFLSSWTFLYRIRIRRRSLQRPNRLPLAQRAIHAFVSVAVKDGRSGCGGDLHPVNRLEECESNAGGRSEL